MRQFNTFTTFPFNAALKTRQANTEAAQAIWQLVAPEQLLHSCQAKSIVEQQLRLTTPSNAVAAKIKLLRPSLLAQLQKQGVEVTAILVKVQVKSDAPAPHKTQKIISTKTAQRLQDAAKELSNTALGAALAKLAEHARK